MVKKKAKAKRRPINWKAIKLAYRKGLMNNLKLANKYKCDEKSIRKKIKKEGWIKDLAAKTEQKTKEKLAKVDGKIVESASDQAVQLVIDHRGDLNVVRTAANTMINDLVVKCRSEPAEDVSYNTMLMRAAIIRHLSQTIKHVIPLERQAYGLNDDDKTNPDEAYTPFADRMKRYAEIDERVIPSPPNLKLIEGKK